MDSLSGAAGAAPVGGRDDAAGLRRSLAVGASVAGINAPAAKAAEDVLCGAAARWNRRAAVGPHSRARLRSAPQCRRAPAAAVRNAAGRGLVNRLRSKGQ